MRQRFVFVVLLNLILLLSMSLSNAQDERLQIVGSHSILSDVIANVAGDAADVTSVMPRGADPHSFQPSPSDLTALADADVVFINGALFEEGLLEVIENAGDDMNIVTASSCVEIIAFGGHDEHGDEEHAHEEGEEHSDEEHDHEEGEDHGDEEHAHEEGEEHSDEEHDHEEGEEHSEMGDMSAMAMLCEQHYAEMEALHEDSHEHGDEEHEEGEEHSDEEHAHEEDEDHEHGDEEHAHEDGHEHEHGKVETLGALYQADCGEGHGHHDEEEGEHEEGEEHGDEHGHDHGACDPHVWMEPHNVMYWTMLIRDTLIELDPANADTYTANATEYLEELDALAHDFVMPMAETLPEENRVLITNHDAFGYFAARYEFEVVGTIIPSLSTLAQASAADVAETIDLIREQNIPAIFAETTVSDDIVQQIADETGVQFYVLYTGSLSDADGPASTYVDYIRYNVTTIVEALGGGM